MLNSNLKVAVIMGSQSDWSTMEAAVEVLTQMGVDTHVEVVSAHRTPQKLADFATQASAKGFAVIIAGAGARPICRAWWRLLPACRCWACRFKARL